MLNLLKSVFSIEYRLEVAEKKLVTALANGDILFVRKIINKYSYLSNTWISTSDISQSASLLHWAVRAGDRNFVKFLLDHNVDMDKFDYNGNTALENACKNGDISTVSLLLDNKADVNAREMMKSPIAYAPDESKGSAPLSTAAARGHVDVVRLLIKKGAHICPYSEGYTRAHNLRGRQPDLPSKIPLLTAIKNNHEEIVEILFEKDRVRKDEYFEYLGYLAYFSIINKKDDIALFFLKKGAQTDYIGRSYYDSRDYNDRPDLLQLSKENKCEKVLRFVEERKLKS